MSNQPMAPPPVPGGTAKTSGLAIASLVLALLFFVPLASVAAIVLGILALVKISSAKGSLGGQGLAIAGLCIGGVCLVMGCMMAAMLLPAISRARAQAQATVSKNYLKQIGLGIGMYQLDHAGKPPNLQALYDQGYVKDPQLFGHPGSGARGIDPSAIDATGDYFYYQISKTDDETAPAYPPGAPIAWEKACWNPGGRINVLYADGFVYVRSPAELERAIAGYSDLYQEPPQMPAALEP